MPVNEKRQSHVALPGCVLRFVLILNELLPGFAFVAADDAHVVVAVAGVSTVGVSSAVSASLELASAL